jgi:hypothetical protein
VVPSVVDPVGASAVESVDAVGSLVLDGAGVVPLDVGSLVEEVGGALDVAVVAVDEAVGDSVGDGLGVAVDTADVGAGDTVDAAVGGDICDAV